MGLVISRAKTKTPLMFDLELSSAPDLFRRVRDAGFVVAIVRMAWSGMPRLGSIGEMSDERPMD